jgi:hypothetical protein
MRSTIQVLVLVALLGGACHCARAYGQRNSVLAIPRDSNVFIDPMDGFGRELKAAFLKEGVSIDIVSDKSMADFEITGEIQPAKHAQEMELVSIRISRLKTQDIVWGYSATGIPDLHSTAESCAKQLKREMHRKH